MIKSKFRSPSADQRRCTFLSKFVLIVVFGVATFSIGINADADIWNEVGDAGQNNIGEAQDIVGSGLLTSIIGNLSSANDVDLYRFRIFDEAAFSASTVGGASFDSQLFLFNANGTGQVANDDFGSFQSTITSQGVFSNGIYYLAISSFGNNPQDGGAGDIFDFTPWPGPNPDQMMPNFGSGPLAGWSNIGFVSGSYTIFLSGAMLVPEPGSMIVCVGGLLLLMSRRRRHV